MNVQSTVVLSGRTGATTASLQVNVEVVSGYGETTNVYAVFTAPEGEFEDTVAVSWYDPKPPELNEAVNVTVLKLLAVVKLDNVACVPSLIETDVLVKSEAAHCTFAL